MGVFYYMYISITGLLGRNHPKGKNSPYKYMDPLDTPAFPPKADEVVTTTDGSQPESGVVTGDNGTPAPLPADQEGTVPQTPTEEDEQKVPYSRMKSVIDARREAERRADEAEERLNQVLSRETPSYRQETPEVEPYNGSLPSYWAKMYGDNDNSRLAYSYELERQEALREEFRREALQAVREERNYESQVIATNERTIDERLEDLSYSLGRELSEREEEALLNIADEYTPKDRDGNYSGDLIPFDKAWEIYNLQQAQSSGTASRQRRTPTMATNMPTSGEPSNRESDNKNWNPLDWNSYSKRIPN